MAFLVFAVVAAVTPGPSNIMLTAAGARAGVLGGLPCLLGVTTGMGALMFVVPLGLGSLVLGQPMLLGAVHWGGVAFLLWLSWKIATSTARVDPAQDAGQVGYLDAAFFQWINPKSWLVTTSAAATYLTPEAGHPLAQATSLAGLFVLASVPCGLLWLALGAAVHRVLHTPRHVRIFNITTAALLALSVTLLLR